MVFPVGASLSGTTGITEADPRPLAKQTLQKYERRANTSEYTCLLSVPYTPTHVFSSKTLVYYEDVGPNFSSKLSSSLSLVKEGCSLIMLMADLLKAFFVVAT